MVDVFVDEQSPFLRRHFSEHRMIFAFAIDRRVAEFVDQIDELPAISIKFLGLASIGLLIKIGTHLNLLRHRQDVQNKRLDKRSLRKRTRVREARFKCKFARLNEMRHHLIHIHPAPKRSFITF